MLITKMRIEQTPDSEYRMKYDPATDEFHQTEYRCLHFDNECGAYYGWLVETGTPPEPHLDVLVLSEASYGIGDIVVCRIIGYFRRNDGDHKLLGVELDSPVNDISELPSEVIQSLRRLYRSKYEGEAWFGHGEAEQVYTSFIANK